MKKSAALTLSCVFAAVVIRKNLEKVAEMSDTDDILNTITLAVVFGAALICIVCGILLIIQISKEISNANTERKFTNCEYFSLSI
jgi:uncharacterized membrane protein